MISCDECQKKIVALFDREGGEGDEALVSQHLRDCPRCRTFQEEMVRIREEFVSLPTVTLPAEAEEELMREAAADLARSKTSSRGKGARSEPRPRKFRRLAWASGLALLSVIVASLLVCVNFSKKVEAVRHDLQIARRDVAVLRAEKELKQAQEKRDTAVSSLHFRIQQLEKRVERFSSPRIVSYPGDIYDLSYGRGEL